MITKATKTLTGFDFRAGEVLLIDKPIRSSSFRIVYEIRKIIKEKKVGHAGTLDPLATGLLILCTGKATKQISLFQDKTKEYTGSFRLGIRTPSMDAETEPSIVRPVESISEGAIREAVKQFTGEIQQMPPMYSAVNFQGKKLYKYARSGVEVPRQNRPVTIYAFDITGIEMPEIFFRVECSKGTYIRVLADDFGEVLGCGAHLSSLRRTRIGEFNVADALTLEEARQLRQNDIV